MRIHPNHLGFTLLLGCLAGLPALSVDMGLPGLPQVQAEFGIDAPSVALTLSYFMVGFGLSQLVIGPLSDRVGRRPVLILSQVGTLVGFLMLFWARMAAGPPMEPR